MKAVYKNVRKRTKALSTSSAPTRIDGKWRGIRKSAIALALVIGTPFGAAAASETCELPGGYAGTYNEAGVCEPVAGDSPSDAGIVSKSAGIVPKSFSNDFISINGTIDATYPAAYAGHPGDIAIGQASRAVSFPGYPPQAANIAIGFGAIAEGGTNAIAIGYRAQTPAVAAVALGYGSNAGAHYSVAIGSGAKVDAATQGSMAIGNGASVTNTGLNSVALGRTSVADRSNTVSVGAVGTERQIVNVRAGTADTDATNFAQLKGTAGSIATAIGGGSVVNTDGTISAPSYTVGGTTVNSIGDAFTNIDGRVTATDGRVTTIDGRVTSIEDDLDDGTVGLVRQDATTRDITVAAASDGDSVNFAGTNGARLLSGVANGVDDSDAATIAQLKASGLVDPNDGRALGALVYDDLSLDRATLGGTNGTVIANMANGLIAVGSREGVNGGQLATIRDDLQSQIGVVSSRVDTIEEGIADGSIGGGGGGPIDDNEGKPISNVGDGVADTDAVNVGQVNARYEQAVSESKTYTDTRFNAMQDDFNQRFEAVDGRIDRMAALSGAYAGMAMNTAGLSGKNRVGAGVGVQGGKTALAVGYQRIVGRRNNASVSIGGAFSGSEKSVSAGAGFSW